MIVFVAKVAIINNDLKIYTGYPGENQRMEFMRKSPRK